jgi:hypothetical protein
MSIFTKLWQSVEPNAANAQKSLLRYLTDFLRSLMPLKTSSPELGPSDQNVPYFSFST